MGIINNLKKEVNNTVKHHKEANIVAKSNGGIKNVQKTKYGVQYNYNNGTGYWVEK